MQTITRASDVTCPPSAALSMHGQGQRPTCCIYFPGGCPSDPARLPCACPLNPLIILSTVLCTATLTRANTALMNENCIGNDAQLKLITRLFQHQAPHYLTEREHATWCTYIVTCTFLLTVKGGKVTDSARALPSAAPHTGSRCSRHNGRLTTEHEGEGGTPKSNVQMHRLRSIAARYVQPQ